MGAGILPLSVFRSSVFILLGQERHNNLWSDFGGTSLKGETIYQTAIREGYEETNGFLGEKYEMYNYVKNNCRDSAIHDYLTHSFFVFLY